LENSKKITILVKTKNKLFGTFLGKNSNYSLDFEQKLNLKIWKE